MSCLMLAALVILISALVYHWQFKRAFIRELMKKGYSPSAAEKEYHDYMLRE